MLDRHIQPLHVGQEGNHQAKRNSGAEQAAIIQHKNTAYTNDQGNRNIPKSFQGRSQGAGPGDSLNIGVAVAGIGCFESLDILIFPVKSLDFTDTGDTLL